MKTILISCIVFSVASCHRVDNDLKKIDSEYSTNTFDGRYIELDDPEILNGITEYAENQKLKRDQCYIILNLRGNSARKIIDIAHASYMLTAEMRWPMHYTIVDDFLIFIESDIDYLNVERNSDNLNFYTALMDKRQLKLEPLGGFNNPSEWHLVSCLNSGYKLHKSNKELKEYEIPCGYHLLRDKVVFDSVWIKKEE